MDESEKIIKDRTDHLSSEWMFWAGKIPYITFPSNWEICVMPFFAGCVIRYMVRDKNDHSKKATFFLDCQNALYDYSKRELVFDEPFWTTNLNSEKYKLNDVEKMLEIIDKSFKTE